MPDPGRTALYRLYDSDDQLLYVGITGSLKTRMSNHESSKLWWPQVTRTEIKWFDRRSQAERAEKQAIEQEGPLHNRCWTAASVRKIPPQRYSDKDAEREVERRLLEDISAGVYAPGFQLVRKDLAERYGCSVAVISFTLHAMAWQGKLLERHNRQYVPDRP